MWRFLIVVNTVLLVVVICQRGIKLSALRRIEKLMATQEERLRGIQGQLTSVADGINTLQQQVADLKANNPDLDDEISGIESTLQAIKDDLNPPAEPPAEPTA